MRKNASKYISRILLAVLLVGPLIMSAAVMQSGSYIIQSDSLNFAGGLSTSTNYVVSDTLGEIGTGFSTSTSYALSAGYQAMQSGYIAITDSANITLPNVSGLSGGTTNGLSTWTITTDDPAGYSLSVAASTNPAFQGTVGTSTIVSIPNYVPASGNADYAFTYGAASSTFGFSPEGVDIIQRYKDNGSVCGTGTNDTVDRCWDGLSSTSASLISQSTGSNHPNGATTTLKYEVGIGTNKIQEAATYTANITATAVAL